MADEERRRCSRSLSLSSRRVVAAWFVIVCSKIIDSSSAVLTELP
jgi:hypothetical protein